MKMTLITAILVVSSVLTGSYMGSYPAAKHFPAVQQEVENNQGQELKSAARKIFMRGKLVSNQKIVEGLSVRDFDMIKAGADSVTALTKGQHWFVLDTTEYRRYSEDMETAAQRLHAAAEDKNLEASALRYFDLTLNCIDCHEYIQKTKY